MQDPGGVRVDADAAAAKLATLDGAGSNASRRK